MTDARTVPLPDDRRLSDEEMLRHAQEFQALMQLRRTVRDFDSRPVRREVIERCIAAAGTAPSGANQQPWHFVAVSDRQVKQRIRVAAEAEEREFYERRAPDEWLDALKPIGTDWRKPYLETAPWLIAIVVRKWGRAGDADPHAEPDGIPERDPRTPGGRGAPVPAAGGRPSGPGDACTGDRAQAAGSHLVLGVGDGAAAPRYSESTYYSGAYDSSAVIPVPL
jgi:hypothetical protein